MSTSATDAFLRLSDADHVQLPAELPSVAHAKLPATYEAAKTSEELITASDVMPRSAVTRAPVIMVPIADIRIGIRRRGERGIKTGLARLAESVQNRGLIHPILLLNGLELVAGHRRLEACRSLGWKEIPARHVDTLSDEDFRLLELEENTQRSDLDSFEVSRQRLAIVQLEEMKAKKSAEEIRGESPHKGRGRPVLSNSARSIEKATGISRRERQRAQQHVTLAETFPVFQRPEWREHQVLRAGEALAEVPVKDQARVAHLIDQDALPPADAIAIIENIGTMPADERGRVLKAAASDDAEERQRALGHAAKAPPMPDPRLGMLGNAHDLLKRAAASKHDAWQPAIQSLTESVARAIAGMKQDEQKERAHDLENSEITTDPSIDTVAP